MSNIIRFPNRFKPERLVLACSECDCQEYVLIIGEDDLDVECSSCGHTATLEAILEVVYSEDTTEESP